MKGRCKNCRKIYVTNSYIVVNARSITCHCGMKLTQFNSRCRDPEIKLSHHQINQVMSTFRIPEAVS